MPFSSDNLLKELNQGKIIDWAVELKNGKEAYTFLVTTLNEGNLNVNQTKNALHALFRIRGHGSELEVLRTCLLLTGHASKAVRSEAVQLCIGLVHLSRLHSKRPLTITPDQHKILRKAVSEGLSPEVAGLATTFLDE